MSFLDSRTHSARQGIGQPVRRAEDRRLITGRGCYSDDVTLPRQAYAAFVRSPHAHARIRRIDVARRAGDAGRARRPHRERTPPSSRGSRIARCRPTPTKFRCAAATARPFFVAPHPPLPADRVRCVGEPVAMVIAETPASRATASSAWSVDYDPLPAVVGSLDAVAPAAPLVWDEAARPTCASIRSRRRRGGRGGGLRPGGARGALRRRASIA